MTQINNLEYGQGDPKTPYVYIVTRRDLTIPQQLVQSCHAVLEISRNFSKDFEHPHLILCTVKNERDLYKFISRLEANHISFATFHEPAIGNSLTAIATECVCGDKRKVFSNLRLMKNEKLETQLT